MTGWDLARIPGGAPRRPVADSRDDARARLESIAAAALAKDPADRPADGGALLRELRGAGGDATMLLASGRLPAASEATQVLRPVRPPRPRKRRYWLRPPLALLLPGRIAR